MDLNKKIVNLPEISLNNFYLAYLEILSSFPPISKLSRKEKMLVAIIMYSNNKYKHLSVSDRYSIVFSTQNRKQMQSYLDISSAVFNNMMTSLRKKNIIDDNNFLNKSYELFVNNEFSITFNFRINDTSKI